MEHASKTHRGVGWRLSAGLLCVGVLSARCDGGEVPITERPPAKADAPGASSAREVRYEIREYAAPAPAQGRLVLIEMVHMGPWRYYDAIRRRIARYHERDPQALVLRETMAPCAGFDRPWVYVVHDHRRIDQRRLGELLDRPTRELLDTTDEDLVPLVAGGGWARVDCQAFAEHPINRSFRETAAQIGYVLQGDQQLFAAGMEVRPADIALRDIETLIQQFLYTTFVSCAATDCVMSPLMGSLLDRRGPAATLLWEVLLELRDAHLLSQIQTALRSGRRTVIVPWGAEHLRGSLYGELAARGYALQGRDSVDYAHCGELLRLRNPEIHPIYSECEARGE